MNWIDVIPWEGLSRQIMTGALIGGRLVTITLFVPFLGGDLAPSTAKIGFAMTLVLLLLPLVGTEPPPQAPLLFFGLFLKEVMIGFSMSFVINILFEAARAAGVLVDTAGGANMATALVPEIKEQATLMANIYYQLSVLFFFALGGHRLFFASIFESFRVVPLMHFPTFTLGLSGMAELVMRTIPYLLLVAMTLAAPVMAALFLTDVALGLINRVSPTIQVYFLALPVKYMIGVILSLLGLNMFIHEITDHGLNLLQQVRALVQLLG